MSPTSKSSNTRPFQPSFTAIADSSADTPSPVVALRKRYHSAGTQAFHKRDRVHGLQLTARSAGCDVALPTRIARSPAKEGTHAHTVGTRSSTRLPGAGAWLVQRGT